MEELVREELETLWGNPIPKKGQPGYRPNIHNLENVHNRLENTQEELEIHENFVENIIDILNGRYGGTAKERLERLYNRYNEFFEERGKFYRRRKKPY